MAQDAVDACVASGKLHDHKPCCTSHLQLRGARSYSPSLFTYIAQHYTVPHRPGLSVYLEHIRLGLSKLCCASEGLGWPPHWLCVCIHVC